ncbi:MAG: hypothetical protein ACRYFE_01835 [Janthinobacterium lividum]
MKLPTSQDHAEGQWFWRRLFVYLATLLFWLLLRDLVLRAPPEHLPRLAEGLMGLMALMSLLYLVAPSAQQVVNLAQLRWGRRS